MKPKIYWYSNDEYGCYICQIPEQEEAYFMTQDEYYVYMATGCGKTTREAYADWIKDCER